MLRGLLKTLPMDCPARRLDHGSSRLHSYRDARSSGRRCMALWVRTSALPVSSLRCAGRSESRAAQRVCFVHFVFLSAPVLTLLKKRHEGNCYISHAVDTSSSTELKAR